MASVAHEHGRSTTPTPASTTSTGARSLQGSDRPVATLPTPRASRIDPSDRVRRAAAWAMTHGMSCFPLVPDGKAPAVRDWEHRASSDPRAVGDWPRRTTGYGIACGPSGLYVVDCDQPKPDTPAPPPEAADATDGYEALLVLAADLGRPMVRDTLTVRTGRGGLHLYYRAPAVDLGNSAGRLAWLVDTRGRGGYVVGPGSVVAGRSYEVVDWAAPAELPGWIADALGARRAASQGGAALVSVPSPVRLAGSAVGPEWAAAALSGEAERIRTAPMDQGNDTVNRAAYTVGRLIGARLLSRDVAEHALTAALDTWTWTAPGDRTRMLRTLARALADGERSPRVVTPTTQRRRAA